MYLVVIIASLFLDRSVDVSKSLRSFSAYDRWLQRTLERTGDSAWMAVLVLAGFIIVPALLVQWIDGVLDGVLFGLFSLLWSLIVLFFCYGPLAIDEELSAYLNAAENGDEEVANDRARRLAGDAGFQGSNTRNLAVIRSLFAQVNTQLVAVIFWFLVLGPFGAVVYRLALQVSRDAGSHDEVSDDIAARAHALVGAMTWLPARVMILAYALAGHFDCTLTYFLGPDSSNAGNTLAQDNDNCLASAGVCAMGLDERAVDTDIADVQTARDLIVRSMVVCLAVVALMTLTGWFA